MKLFSFTGYGYLLLAAALLAGGARAETTANSAHEVVRETTEAVMEAVTEAKAGDEVTEAYYREIQSLLDPVVDFRGFARGVMGPYATSARYRSLDQAGREKLAAQLDRFTEVMREGLVRTYSKGLLAFGGSRIEVAEPEGGDAGRDSRETVQQLIFKEGSEPYVVLYQMGRDRDGSWKLRNMIIENVNLGEIYRSQFESSARQYNGDLDKVIANWSAVDLDA